MSGEAWAGGSANYGTTPFVAHFAKGGWKVQNLPTKGAVVNRLSGLAAVSSKSVWGVGRYNDNTGHSQPLAEHWDGKAWKAVALPAAGTDGSLYLVTAFGSTDVWATGSINTGRTSYAPLMTHWNGHQWLVMKPTFKPALSTQTEFSTAPLSALGSVQGGLNSYTSSGGWHSYLTQYVTTGPWTATAVPNQGNQQNILSAMLPSSNALVLFGYGQTSSTALSQSWVLDYGPHGFTKEAFPKANATIFAAARSSKAGTIAVGATFVNQTEYYAAGFLSWRGKWYALPREKTFGTYLSVTAIPGTPDFWAVGNVSSSGPPFVDRIDCPVM
ncbi:MAG TPA: hypothetical protein VKB39_05225 [Candidatus Baltobacteraceae bacterium]|nr:hypothetical protein [Candidatus Baltobacteraceae bacterium]